MKTQYRILLWLFVILGLAAAVVSGYYLLPDWAALQTDYIAYTRSTQAHDLFNLTKTYDRQSIFRVNCFAEGVGVLLGFVIASIGVHGLAVSSTIANRCAGSSRASQD